MVFGDSGEYKENKEYFRYWRGETAFGCGEGRTVGSEQFQCGADEKVEHLG